jgi:hypothetical protein
MKTHLLVLPVVGALFAAGASNAQLYVPEPPGNLELIFTNVGSKPTDFRTTVFIPGRPPVPLQVERLEAGRTALGTGGSSVAGFTVVEVFKPGLHLSATFSNFDQSSVFRLPVFTSRDVAPRRRPITFQFSPELQPQETAALVVLSVTESTTKCSVSLYNDSGEVFSSSFTVEASLPLAVVDLVSPAIVTYVRVRCGKPALAYVYRDTATTIEFLSPSASE